MREANELLRWVRHMRETAVGAPGEGAKDFIREALLDQARTADYSALRLTALLDNDLPAHRRIVGE